MLRTIGHLGSKFVQKKELFHKMREEEQQRITIEQTILKEQVRKSMEC